MPTAVPTPVAPSLGTVRVLRGRTVRLRVLVDQRVTLTLTLRRAGKRVARKVIRYRGPGAVTLPLGALRRGRYRVLVRATSELGAGSATAGARFRVR